MKLLTIQEVQNELLTLMKILHAFLEEHRLSYYLIGGSALGAVRHSGFIPWDDDIDIGMYRNDYETLLNLREEFNLKHKDTYEFIDFHNHNRCDFVLSRIYINGTYIDDPSVAYTRLDKRLYLDIFPLDNVPADETISQKYAKKIAGQKKLLSFCDTRDYNTGKIKRNMKKIIAFFLSPFRANILKRCDGLMKRYQHSETEHVCSLCSQYSYKKQKMPRAYYGQPTLYRFENCHFYIPEQADRYLTQLYGKDYMELPPENKRRKGHDIYQTHEE